MNLSIIMAYKSDGGIRDKHLEWTKNRYKMIFPEAELIISQDNESSKENQWGDFNKSKTINLGVEKSTRDIIFITDIDMIFHKESITRSLKIVDQYACIVPFDTIYKMNKNLTIQTLSCKHFDEGIIRKSEIKSYYSDKRTSGCIMLKKENFYKANGYDERFIGWGAEDTAFIIATSTMTKKKLLVLDGGAYHMWHAKGKNFKKENTQNLYNRYLQAKGKTKEMGMLISGGSKCEKFHF